MKATIIKMINKQFLILFLVIFLCNPFVLADRNIFSGVINTTSNISLLNLVYPINNSNLNNNIIFALNPNNPSSIINGTYTLNCSIDYTECNLTNSTFNQVYNYESENGIIEHNSASVWADYEAIYHFNSDGYNSQGNTSKNLILNNVSIVTGKIGNSIKLYGTPISNMTTVNIPFQPRSNFTISLWFRKDGEGYDTGEGLNMTTIFREGTSSETKYTLQIPSQFSDVFRFRILSKNCDSSFTPLSNTWYNIITVFNGSYGFMYINGIKECEIATLAGDLESTEDLVLGDDNDNKDYCNCTIDELRYTYKSFNEQEAKAEYELMQYAYTPIINKTVEISIIPTPEIEGYNNTYQQTDLIKIIFDAIGFILVLVILPFLTIMVLFLLFLWIGKRKR